MSMWLKFESLLPRRASKFLQTKIGFSGDTYEIRKKVGFVFIYPFLVGIVLALAAMISKMATNYLEIAGFYVTGVAVSFIAIYLFIDYQATSRARKIEQSLPDSLELIAVNINSGLTIENALVEAARPEFGELARLFKHAAKELFAGSSLQKALHEMGEKIESELLRRTIMLISEGMKKGATLGELLLRIAADLRTEAALKREINSNISMYIALILMATALGAPILFGASSVVSEVFAKQSLEIKGDASNGSIPLFGTLLSQSKTGAKFNSGDLELIAITSMALTCLFASMMIGVIKYNRESTGLRYLPVLLLVSFLIFYLGSAILKKTIVGI